MYIFLKIAGTRRFRFQVGYSVPEPEPAGNGSKKMRTRTGLDRLLILRTGTGTTHLGSKSGYLLPMLTPIRKSYIYLVM